MRADNRSCAARSGRREGCDGAFESASSVERTWRMEEEKLLLLPLLLLRCCLLLLLRCCLLLLLQHGSGGEGGGGEGNRWSWRW